MSKTVKRILVDQLKIGMYVNKLGGSWMNHPFLRSSFLLTEVEDLKKIKQAGIKDIWIDESKGKSVEDSPAKQTNDTKPVEPSPASSSNSTKASDTKDQKSPMDLEVQRARVLCKKAKKQVMKMFDDARLGNAVDPETTMPLVGEIQSAVERNSAAILSVARLKTHDDYTYMHSVAVCALMLALAKQLKLDEQTMKAAGVAGLMHDLGKAFMPVEIINKPGKLTDAEFDVMKKHPAAGAKVLIEGGAEKEVIDVALHHHEKINGFGYPQGLKEDQISVLAKMGAICDVYDAVTSERAYKKPWDPATSIREMASWEGHFDKNIFAAFVKSVGIYPVGSLVRLSSQRLAVVIEPGEKSLLEPKVKVFFSVKMKEPIKVEVIDLAAANCKDSIEGPENPDKWKFTHLESLWQ